MFIEIHGAGFDNKGAELMLRTVVEELRDRIPELVAAIDPGYGPYLSRTKLGLYQIFPPRGHVGSSNFIQKFERQKRYDLVRWEKIFYRLTGAYPNQYGCISLSEIQGLIDIAGFAYTDEWGPQPAKDFARLTAYYKAKGRPIILMPQAFGPFHSEEIRSAFQQIVENATLIFARDRESYEFVKEFCSNSEKISCAPDITLFYGQPQDRTLPYNQAKHVSVVPNVRMLDQGRQAWGEKYLTYLTDLVRELTRLELDVSIVVHDASGTDLKLAKSILQTVGSPKLTLVREDDPLRLKQVIGNSFLVIGSRYHSLVSAFSMQVPSLAMGWSHKYQMLFRDFGVDELMILPDTPMDKAVQQLLQLTETRINNGYRDRISRRLHEMARINHEMWDKVVSTFKDYIPTS